MAGTYPVAGYNVYSSGTLLASTATINYTATGLSSGTAYTFTVAAYDNQGNVGQQSSSVVATPSITPGLVHGSAYSVTSSSLFGTRANYNFGSYTWKGQQHMHLCWALMDQGFPATYTDAGWNAVLGGLTAFWDNGAGHVSLPAYTSTVYGGQSYTGFGLVAGGPSQSGYYFQRGMGNATMADPRYTGGLAVSVNGIGSGYTGEFYSFKYQTTAVEPTVGNCKAWRRSLYFTSGGPPYDCEIINYFEPSSFCYTLQGTGNSGPTWVGPWASQSGQGSNVFGSLSSTTSNVIPTATNWNRFSTWINFTPGSGNYGTVATYANGQPLYFSNSGLTPPLLLVPGIDASATINNSSTWSAPVTSSGGTSPSGMIIGSESAVNTSSTTYTQNFADIYYDFTPARIEVTDGTNVEIMCITSWSPSAINYLFNKGALTSGSGRTLNVYNASNTLVYTTTVTVN